MALFQKTRTVLEIPCDKILPSADQPRKIFAQKELEELSCSIALHGILQPLTVRKGENGHYILIAGERRLWAAKLCGLATVPCIVCDKSAEESALLSLLENIQRQDLGFYEEALAMEKILQTQDLTQSKLASLLGRSQPSVANILRVLKLDGDELEALAQSGGTARHARALLPLNRQQREPILRRICKEGITVAKTEQLVQQALSPPKAHLRKGVLKDVRIFFNSVDKACSLMKESGIPVEMDKREEDEHYLITLRVPKGKSFVME